MRHFRLADVSGWTWQLKDGISLIPDARAEKLILLRWPSTIAIDDSDGKVEAILRLLSDGPASTVELAMRVGHSMYDVETTILDILWVAGLVQPSRCSGGREVFAISPELSPPVDWEKSSSDTKPSSVVLSRFAAMTMRDQRLVLESPIAWASVTITDPHLAGSALKVLMEKEVTWTELLLECVDALLFTGIAVRRGDLELSNSAEAQWSQHELRFHTYSRLGFSNAPGRGFGATNWAAELYPSVPPKPCHEFGAIVELPEPWDDMQFSSRPLHSVLSERKSIRHHDHENPINLGQLSEFLWRTSRACKVTGGIGKSALVHRPYPTGGALGELEIFLLATNVQSLEPAFYYYDSHEHRLAFVRTHEYRPVRRMLRCAQMSSGTRSSPQVLIVISARVGRVMQKYESMAYALILKNVGVLIQTMYLTATDMALAACAIGSGDDQAFGEVTGLNRLEQPSVGEFILGSRRGLDEEVSSV